MRKDPINPPSRIKIQHVGSIANVNDLDCSDPLLKLSGYQEVTGLSSRTIGRVFLAYILQTHGPVRGVTWIALSPDQRDNEGSRVVVGATNLMRQAYQTVQKAFGDKLTGRDILFANDLSHARSMLYSIRLDG